MRTSVRPAVESDCINICQSCKCCEMDWVDCWRCGGEGGDDGEALMEEDPLWYGPDDFRPCDVCRQAGGFSTCGGCCSKESVSP